MACPGFRLSSSIRTSPGGGSIWSEHTAPAGREAVAGRYAGVEGAIGPRSTGGLDDETGGHDGLLSPAHRVDRGMAWLERARFQRAPLRSVSGFRPVAVSVECDPDLLDALDHGRAEPA